MLIRTGKNWVFELFLRHGWLVKQRRLRRRQGSGSCLPIIAAECQSLEQRILLSTITVTSLADNLTVDGKVTLREALQAANTDASVDGSVAGQAGVQNVIVIDTKLNGTISLNKALGQLTISSSVEIDGLGAANTVIDAQQFSRIFDITNTAGDVRFDGLTLENGKTTAASDSGGAIRSVSTGTLTVSNSTLSGSSTSGDGSYGGAIASGNGGLTVTNSGLFGNSTAGIGSYGGAIYSGNGALTVTNSTLSGNFTTGNSAFGGAILSFGAVAVTNSTLSGNSTTGSRTNGGAIDSFGASTVTNSTLSGNSTAGCRSYGGAINSKGALTVTNSTLSGNTTSGQFGRGGAIFASAALTLTNSTLSGNSTGGNFSSGGGIFSLGTPTLTNSTVVQNHVANAGGGGIVSLGATLTLGNSIVAQNTDNGTAPDFYPGPSLTSVTITHSLIGDNTGTHLKAAPVRSPDANGNFVGTHAAPINPKLGALAYNGGPTQTLTLLAGSPAIDAGSNSQATDPGPDGIAGSADDIPLVDDQRGAPFGRTFGAAVDMGAYESQTLSLVVNSSVDSLDATYDPAHVTLRDAIALADDNPGADTIAFAALGGTPIVLTAGQLTISDSVTITGNGTGNTIIDAQQNSRIFDITNTAGNVTLDSLTLENGKTTAAGDLGGAIRCVSTGTLIVTNSTLSGNSTTGPISFGGAIYSNSALTVTNSTLSGNSTTAGGAFGGAIFSGAALSVTNSTLSGNSTTGFDAPGGAVCSLGTLTVTNSTLSGNFTTANSSGGGAIVSYAPLTVTNSTIVQNHATNAAGGGIKEYTSLTVTLRNTILAQNTDFLGGHPDLYLKNPGTLTITHSLIGDNTGTGLTAAPVGSPDVNGNLIGTGAAKIDPQLDDLANNGGLTRTMALLVGSPAIDAGSNAQATDPGPNGIAGNADDIPIVNDQRGDGFARILGTVDMGAYEIQLLATPTVNFLATNSHLPILTGTFDRLNTRVLQVGVNGTTFTLGTSSQLTIASFGIWTLTTTATLPDGTYDVVVQTTDPSGDAAADTTTIDLIVDTAAPAATAFTGEYAVATQGSSALTLASISQKGTALTLNGSSTASATVASTSLLLIGGLKAAYGDSQIIFGPTGTFANQVWTKLDLPADYTNPAGARVHITQNGNGLTFSDRNGTQSPGTWVNPTQISAYNETVTVGSGQSTGQLLWSDGTIWSEVVKITGTNHGSGTTTIQAVPSKMLVTDYLTGSGATVHTVQTGTTNIVFIDRVGKLVLGTYSPYDPATNTPQATAPNYPGYTASIVGNTITWTDGKPADTVVWTKTTSPASTITVTDYTNQNGVPVHVIQNATNAFVIVDGLGNTSLGHYLTATTGIADRYPTDVATFTSNQVIWSDGVFVWTTTNNPPLLITFTDTSNAISHMKLLTPTTLVGLDGTFKAIQGTRLNGKIFWSNGQVWDNLDFNALNAFLEMGTVYP